MARPSKNQLWDDAFRESADPARARHFFNLLKSAGHGALLQRSPAPQVRILAALFAGSESLSASVVAHPDWIAGTLDPASLEHPRQKMGLWREVNGWLGPALETKDYPGALAKLREFKQREMLRIGARDLARLGDVVAITREISNVADVCLEVLYKVSWEQLTARLGLPYHQEVDAPWRRTHFTVLGMGKLGGQELNYSSDVDLLFVYSAEGYTFKNPPRGTEMTGRGQPNSQFFRQLAEAIIAEGTKMGPEGAIFRIDMRLRPEGKGGPLARSIHSYENYYAQYGQTWERMMLIKARGVAGDEGLAAEFLEMIQPFRYPRTQGEELAKEVAEMKARIENEVVKAGEMERNVKLGRGGIREIEFIAQTHQVLYGGRIPFLQGGQTLPALEKMVQYQLLSREDARGLAAAYSFLRDVEHRLQMDANRQTHTIPTDRKSRERLSALMGFESLREFETALSSHTTLVRSVYDRFFKGASVRPAHELPRDLERSEEQWKAILREHSFKDVERAWRMTREFVLGPGFGHVSARTSDTGLLLLSKMLQACRREGQTPPSLYLSDPDRVLARLDTFVSSYGARATLYEAWRSNPSLFRLLLFVFDRSEFLAEAAIRTPDLIDTVEQTGQLRRPKTRDATARELGFGLEDADQHLWMRKYSEAELMRIGLRDILGLATPAQTQGELTALAEASLDHALHVVLRRHGLKKPPFAIVALGKLGGAELVYGSDSDVVFVAPDGTTNLPKLCQVAIDLLDLLTRRTEKGIVMVTDTRLRPDGEKGLLVNTLTAYREYYQKRALLWEIQSLTRARPVVGDAAVGEAFAKMADELTNFTKPKVACFQPDWKKEIARMRQRIEKERTPAGQQLLAIKTGEGGLIDAEFMAQADCLESGRREPNTVRALHQAATDGKLSRSADVVQNYQKLLNVELILRRWSLEPENVLPTDPAPLYRVAVRCGFHDAETFLNEVSSYRSALRAAYNAFFGVR